MLNQRLKELAIGQPDRVGFAPFWLALNNVLSIIKENQVMGGQEVIDTPELIVDVTKQWESIVAQPDEYLTTFAGLNFAAGGGLPLQFGKTESFIWQSLEKAMDQDEMIEIAGIRFSKAELELMGKFYRWQSKHSGVRLHCIDERLKESPEHHDHEVHDACGACAAARAAAGVEDDFENVLLTELGQDSKEPIYEDMPNHDSLVIYADLLGRGRAVSAAKRAELKAKHALAFNVTLPVEAIAQFAVETEANLPLLIAALSKWNVQIARNIIGGHHNESHQHAVETRLVVDQRDVSASPELMAMIELALSKVVSAEKQLVIAE